MTAIATREFETYAEWDELARAEGWTDGLPVAPPEDEKVEAILAHLRRDPNELVGIVAPARGHATIEQVAIQCVMAGCAPDHVPVVIAALEAMLEPQFNLHGVQSTTNPCAPLAIVTGPIVEELGFNVSNGVFGGGGYANAAIGRAVRLILWNIGGGKPSVNDMSSLGQPAKYAFCVAENHALSPWPGIQTDAGFGADDSCVTVFACQSPYPALISGTGDFILRLLAESIPSTTINMYHAAGQFLLILAIKPARELAEAGYDKLAIREYLFENARLKVGHLRKWNVLGATDPLASYFGAGGLAEERPKLDDLADEERLPIFLSADDIHILVTGGDTQWWGGFCPGWGNYGGYAITKRISKEA